MNILGYYSRFCDDCGMYWHFVICNFYDFSY